MPESYLQNLLADRIGGPLYGKSSTIYKFEKIKRAKRAARAAHPDTMLIDMGVGEPDEMAFPEVVETLAQEARKPDNRGYADNGDQVLKEAAARYLERVCGVAGVNPDTEILHSIGSKAALSILPKVLVNPGDFVLMTTPGYPVFGTHARYLGGNVFSIPLVESNAFLPDLETVPAEVLARAKALVLNYPNNPTGASATPECFSQVVEFALKNRLAVIHDAAYAALVYEGRPLSFLATPGAKEVGVELHSASKSFNMTGWRCGFVAGNELLVRAYGDVKDNSDSGQFLAIQHAAAYCFDHPEITEQIAAKYSRRMDGLVQVLQRLGFRARKPRGSFFLYVPAPKAAILPGQPETAFRSAEEVSHWLITEKLISTVPWDDAGAYLRFSVTFEACGESGEQAVLAELASRLGDVTFRF
ncbi:MAG TPA: LL-diaminopimelate aminotransferase [Candidatus Paceibacterota bacterium]|nr:LL-diaminopimelate aminotransferase [Verrucomicrobiota bacterium]HOX01308.1 LL-diaminopimelate aminotransferase [Verrucomicrobiota bacterium]HRZ45468.1 LL-diaminopimelate aminotransferase [Candidatus Paceibacterota bacterium]